MLEPLKGTEAGVGELVRNAPDAASLLRALGRRRRRASAVDVVDRTVRTRHGATDDRCAD